MAVLESAISPTGWMEYHGAVLAGNAVCTATPDGTVTEYDLSTGETRVRTTGLCAAVQQGNPPVELTSVADGYLLATVWTCLLYTSSWDSAMLPAYRQANSSPTHCTSSSGKYNFQKQLKKPRYSA